MPLLVRDLEAMLVNKLGFTWRDGKHRIYSLEVRGLRVASTALSHGERELGDNRVSEMARQLGIARKQLLALVQCTLNRDDYLRIIGVTTD